MAVVQSGRPSLITALRAATSELHAELDARVALRPGTLTRAQYLTFLRASSAVVAPLEASIACWLGVSTDGVSRTSALHQDLLALGAADAPPASVPELHSLAEAMGAAYVVEGSALGGAVLARVVATALGADAPRRYLMLRGEHTGARWREFLHALETWGASASESGWDTACATARATFAAYGAAFDAAGAFA